MSDPRTQLLSRARAVAAIIEQEADLIEKEARVTPRVHDALAESGLYWIAAPCETGGAGANIGTCIEVVEEISRADGSTGWSFFVNLSVSVVILPFVSDEQIALFFSGDERMIGAGQLNLLGRAEQVAGGYRCSGRHSFASGSAYANWVCAQYPVYRDGEAVFESDGAPRTIIALLHRNEVAFQGNWDVMGLAGTGSYDYEVRDRLVPDGRVIDGRILAPSAIALRGQPMIHLGTFAVGLALHSACVLGIMKRAVQELTALVSRKSRPGYVGPIAEDPVFLHQFASMDAEYHAVRGRFMAVFSQMEEKVRNGEALVPRDHAVIQQTATWVHAKALEIVSFCFRWAGTTPVRNPNALGRCMRDMLVANAHMLFDPKTLTNAGAELIREPL